MKNLEKRIAESIIVLAFTLSSAHSMMVDLFANAKPNPTMTVLSDELFCSEHVLRSNLSTLEAKGFHAIQQQMASSELLAQQKEQARIKKGPLLAGLFFSELGTEIEKLFARRRLLEER